MHTSIRVWRHTSVKHREMRDTRLRSPLLGAPRSIVQSRDGIFCDARRAYGPAAGAHVVRAVV